MYFNARGPVGVLKTKIKKKNIKKERYTNRIGYDGYAYGAHGPIGARETQWRCAVN